MSFGRLRLSENWMSRFSSANRTYMPAMFYSGPDTFRFKVTDTGDGSSAPLTSAETTVSITVNNPPPLPPGNTCNGFYSGTFSDNVTVMNGQTCAFINGGVNGNVTVNPGGTLNFNHSSISRNVELQRGGNLVLNSSNVGGDVHLNGGGTFSITGRTINGNLHIQNIPHGAAMNQIVGVHVDHNLEFHNNGTAVVIGAANVIGGNLHIQNNTASVQVLSNTIGGNLQCGGNSSISGSGNTAASKSGQCSAF
jgi:hypothetical protein